MPPAVAGENLRSAGVVRDVALNAANGGIDPAAVERAALVKLARKYVPGQTVEAALQAPDALFACAMSQGDYDEELALFEDLGEERLGTSFANARREDFTPRLWAYWELRLGIARPGAAPRGHVRP